MSSSTDSVREQPCVSVVVPFFNSERYIASCVESLVGQEGVGGPYEILFVNNRSSDGSADIVARFPEVTVLSEETPGAYAARNAAIRVARAPLIAFTDADCIASRSWLRSIRDGMADPSVAVLLGHFRYPPTASPWLQLLGAYENAKTEYVLDRCTPAYHFAYGNNMAVRASVFSELGLFEEWQRAADSELIHRLAARRPDLRLVYRRSMRVTHAEFSRARDRVRRLSLYSKTNSKIGSFHELSVMQRLAVLMRMIRPRRPGGDRVKSSG